jgi:uncharacterized protein DUF5994
MAALTSRDAEPVDTLALARLDDDGAPPAVTSVISYGSAKTARSPSGAPASAPAPIPTGMSPARVSFDAALIRHGAVDGGWWPRSRNAHTELPGLIVALDARPGVRVQRLAVHRDEWDEIPHQLTADNGHFVRIDWFTTIRRSTVSVTAAGGREPIALLVVPPDTPAETAWAAMNVAATNPGHPAGRGRPYRRRGSRAPVGKGPIDGDAPRQRDSTVDP